MKHWSLALVVAAGSVAAADAPAGTAIPGDPAHVHMPKVRGMIRKDAEATIHAAGISGDIRVENLEDKKNEATWVVCNQTPSEGQVMPIKWDITLGFCNPHPQTVEDRRPKIEGMTVEDAKKKIKEIGFKGKVEVKPLSETDPDCKPGTVCRAEPLRWYVDLDSEMTIVTLRTQREVKITLPK